jgi:mannose-6-phosphate isomerase-like protein (cupin superfamily)
VAAGFLIQIAAAAFPAWELPNWSLRLVIALLLIGFPVALVLAWAYDITTDLLDLRVAPGKGVPRHTHTREDEALFVISGELEATVGDEIFTLRAGETLIAPRNIPHQLRIPAT